MTFQEGLPVQFELPELSPGATVAVVDQYPSQVTATRGSQTREAFQWKYLQI